MEEKRETAAAVVPAAPAPDPSAAILAKLDEMNMKILAMQNPPVATPRPRVEITQEGLNDLLVNKFGDPNAEDESAKIRAIHKRRYDFLIKNWEKLKEHYPIVHNANTDTASGALTVGVLSSGLVVVANNRLAPLAAYTRNFTSGRTGRNVIYVPKTVAGGTAQSNPTSFEDTTNFVGEMDDIPLTPAHIVSGGHITNAELQNGWRMDWWVKKKIGELSDKVQSVVNAIIVVGTYTNTRVTAATAASWGSAELKEAWATIKNSTVKSITLDGSFYANFLPDDLESFNPLAGNTYPGWDNFYMNNYWTGAAATTFGFANGPDALCIGAALPVTAPGESRVLAREATTLPDLGISIDVCNWFATAGRVSWATFELMFAAGAGDTSQGVIIGTT